MKKTLLIISMLFIVYISKAGEFEKLFDYEYLNSHYFNICVSGDSSVYICGWPNSILISSDKGNTWKKSLIKKNINNTFLSIVVSGKTVIAVGSLGTICYSNDGGSSWNFADSITPELLNSVVLLDSKTGAAFGSSGGIIKTSDSGKTWRKIESEIKEPIKTALVTDLKTIFIATQSGIIYKSQDYGETWLKVETAAGTFTPLNFSYSFDKSIYLLTNICLLKSTDDGNSWVILKQPDKSYTNCCFIRDGNGYFAGDSSKILYIEHDTVEANSYNLKSVLLSQNYAFFKTIKFIDENCGFAVGNNNLILRTLDGGKKWELLSYLNGFRYAFDGVHFLNDSVGFVGGYKETVYKTTNNGITWEPVPKLDDRNSSSQIYQIFFFDSEKGLMISSAWNGTLLTTTDGGKTFARDSVDELYGAFPNFLPIDNEKFFLYGTWYINENFHAYCVNKSFDGQWWNRCVFDSIYIRCACTADPANIYISGSILDSTWMPELPNTFQRGVIFHSSDTGKTWDKTFFDFVAEISSVFFVNKYIGYAYGTSMDIKKWKLQTFDGGKNWLILDSNISYTPYYVNFINSKYVIGLTEEGLVLLSTDNGTQWKKNEFTEANSFYGYDISTKEKYTYITGIIGEITPAILRLKLKDSLTSIKEIQAERALISYISPPYPNPSHNIINFDMVWDLKYSIKDLKLRIYNLYGIELEKPSLEFFEKTNNTAFVQWNANGLSNGIYFVQFEINGNKTARTQKVIVY